MILIDQKICKLIDEYRENHLNKDGSKFWNDSKRFPHSIKYNPDNELSFTFVKTYSVILARTLGISIINNDEYIKSVSKKFDIPKYIPKFENNNNENDIKTNEENPLNNYDDIELLVEKLLKGTENEEINSIKQEIEGINIDCRKINLENFEKDDDLNGHVDFIYSCSNIRARNYNIKEIEKQKLKMIAGRIVPAMAATTLQ